ncbi:hypothetical protein C8R44DRAFT_725784 [Mycena epipterygia]|nr:hypothetical protein C8R44DRAFT_725784 [Mycena epipterygia]
MYSIYSTTPATEDQLLNRQSLGALPLRRIRWRLAASAGARQKPSSRWTNHDHECMMSVQHTNVASAASASSVFIQSLRILRLPEASWLWLLLECDGDQKSNHPCMGLTLIYHQAPFVCTRADVQRGAHLRAPVAASARRSDIGRYLRCEWSDSDACFIIAGSAGAGGWGMTSNALAGQSKTGLRTCVGSSYAGAPRDFLPRAFAVLMWCGGYLLMIMEWDVPAVVALSVFSRGATICTNPRLPLCNTHLGFLRYKLFGRLQLEGEALLGAMDR